MISDYSNIDKLIELKDDFSYYTEHKKLIDVVNEYLSKDEWILIAVFYGNQHIDDKRFLLGHIKQQELKSNPSK